MVGAELLYVTCNRLYTTCNRLCTVYNKVTQLLNKAHNKMVVIEARSSFIATMMIKKLAYVTNWWDW